MSTPASPLAGATAVTAADLFEEPDLLKQAQDEFAASTKGREYKTPLPAGTKPRQVIKA